MKSINSNSHKSSFIKLKIDLEDMPHPVFRRVLLPDDVNMLQLHYIIQITMGWQFAHLFQFSDKKYDATIRIALPFDDDDDFGIDVFAADEISLKSEFQINRSAKPFWYWYDFGDSWYHRITFQKPTKKDKEVFNGAPVCVEAFGACPPEDVGGPWGYSEFLEIIRDKKHSEYKEFREWAGIPLNRKYNFENVDVESVNKNLLDYYHSNDWEITTDEYF